MEEQKPNGEIKEEQKQQAPEKYDPNPDLQEIFTVITRGGWKIVGKMFARDGRIYNVSTVDMAPSAKFAEVSVLLEECRLEMQAQIMQDRMRPNIIKPDTKFQREILRGNKAN